MSAAAAVFALGDPISYGLWDGRQVPCKVSANNSKSGLPDELTVTATISGTCRKGARINLDSAFWEGLTP